MPNAKCKKKSGSSSDFTLRDYADADTARNRSRKSDEMLQASCVDWDWDDDVDEEIDLVEVETEDGSKVFVAQKILSQKETTYVNYWNENEHGGREYPIDMWFQISKYVVPEDVGRFASICQATFAVTRSANFWFHLYRKHYKKNSNLPPRLQPEQMMLRYGLRSCVIRSLHYTYAPFISQNNGYNFYSPKNLLKRKCLSMWYKKPKDHWVFYFKLKLVNQSLYRSSKSETNKRSIFDILDDIMANPDDDCKILKVHCSCFSDAPPVMGMILNVIFTKVAGDMRHNNLSLGFSERLQNNVELQDCTIVLNHILKMEVLDWWHPEYPHSEEFLPSSIINNCDNSAGSFGF